MENTKIEWADHTFNIAHGCMKVSPGCENCYAETLSKRFGKDIWGPAKTTSRQQMSESYWNEPLKWNEKAKEAGVRARVFTSSMADVFEDHVDLEYARWRLMRLIEHTPNLIWMILTKRPENVIGMMADYGLVVPELWLQEMGDRVWIGTSVEDQKRAEQRIPHLLAIPAAVRFLSVEPLLGAIYLRSYAYPLGHGVMGRAISETERGIDWVIVGGESGPGAREMSWKWASRIVEDCRDCGVPVFVKQAGSALAKASGYAHSKGGDSSEWPLELRVREFPQTA